MAAKLQMSASDLESCLREVSSFFGELSDFASTGTFHHGLVRGSVRGGARLQTLVPFRVSALPSLSLSSRSVEEQLELQSSRCFVCGSRVETGFLRTLGVGASFSPCRLLDALVCNRWCHSSQHRVIPARVLHNWDFTPHRVSAMAARLLDALDAAPIVHVERVNASLLEQVRALRHVKALRGQLHLLWRVSQRDASAREAVQEVLHRELSDRDYLWREEHGALSMRDLKDVKAKTLERLLADAVETAGEVIEEDFAHLGERCTVCDKSERLFAFHVHLVSVCAHCGGLMHKACSRRAESACRGCAAARGAQGRG